MESIHEQSGIINKIKYIFTQNLTLRKFNFHLNISAQRSLTKGNHGEY